MNPRNDKILKKIESDSSRPLRHQEISLLGRPISREENLKYYLEYPIKLLEAKEDDENVISIKSACEWGFESLDDENQTISFLQLCIALEAVLGEDLNTDHLTKSLADRCSYLLGGTIEKRREYREKFMKLYDTRSKLVHGRKVRLAEEEIEHLNWGGWALRSLIRKEFFQYKRAMNL